MSHPSSRPLLSAAIATCGLMLGLATGPADAEEQRTVARWPGGRPAVVQVWEGSHHLYDDHLDKEGRITVRVTWDADGVHAIWRQYRLDGSVEVQWQTEDGLRHGEEQGLDAEGHLVRTVPWRKGKRHGVIREMDSQGRLLSETPYSQDNPIGPLVTFYPSGGRRSVCPLADHRRHGVEIVWSPEGRKQAEIGWLHGVQDGPARYFSPEGWVQAEILWKKGATTGKEVQFHKSGKKLAEIPLRPDGTRDGLSVYFDEEGHKAAERPWQNGKLNGWDRRWDGSGRKTGEVEWKDNEACCGEKTFWPSGALQSLRTWVDMSGDGTETVYFDRDPDSGTENRKQMVVALIAKRKQGPAQVLDRDGRPWSELSFVDDLRNGVEVRFHPTGERAAEYHWRSDRIVGMATTWWPNGQKQSEFPADDGAGTGVERRWDREGRLQMEVPLVAGKKQGIARVYGPDGKLAATQTWLDDRQTGPEVRYWLGKPAGTWVWKDGELISSPPRPVPRKAPTRVATEESGESLEVAGAADANADSDVVREAARAAAQRAEVRHGAPQADGEGGGAAEPDKKASGKGALPAVVRTFWPNGKLRGVYPRVGKGTEVQFHANGEVAVVVPIVAGVREGIARTFDRGGALVATCTMSAVTKTERRSFWRGAVSEPASACGGWGNPWELLAPGSRMGHWRANCSTTQPCHRGLRSSTTATALCAPTCSCASAAAMVWRPSTPKQAPNGQK